LNSCAKKVLLVYGGLTLVVGFFLVPVRRTTTIEPISFTGPYGVRKITDRYEYTDLAAYLSSQKAPATVGLNVRITTNLRPSPYLIEIGSTIFVGLMSWVLFCVFIRRKTQPRADPEASDDKNLWFRRSPRRKASSGRQKSHEFERRRHYIPGKIKI